MKRDAKWFPYLWLSLLSFGAFLLELASIFFIEKLLFRFDLSQYTPAQKSVHHLTTVAVWLLVMGTALFYSRRRYGFPSKSKTEKISFQGGIVVFLCLLGCKAITLMDWHTLKILGEWKEKTPFLFFTQYCYYLAEMGLVLLIIAYGQKAFETLLNKESSIPFGGFLLAVTWGAFHFVSRGAGLELWNGFSCMLFSVLSGVMYLKVQRNVFYSYLLIALGYLL